MKPIRTLLLPLFGLAALGLAGCDDGYGEESGEKLDEAIEDVREGAEDAAEETEDALEEVGDEVEDATDGR
jgi:hypothetical protein